MLKFTAISITALLLCSVASPSLAQQGAAAQAPAKSQTQYVIEGSCPFLSNGDTLLLASVIDGNALQPRDTAYVSSGRFTFRGEQEGAELVFLVNLRNKQLAGGGPFILESGRLSVTLPEAPNPPFVTGNASNDKWVAFNRVEEQYVSQMRPLATAFKNADTPEDERLRVRGQLDTLATQRMGAVVDFITDEATTKIGDMVFEMYFPMLNDHDRAALLKLLSVNNPQLPGCRRILQQLDQEARKVRSQPGAHFVDFEMADLKGKRVSLSSVVSANKYTLLDFWASWCGPCRMEMPTVKQAYGLFHKKGLEVVGVSLDSNLAAWQRAVLQLDLPWIHLSDLRGWACEAGQMYGVHSIPSCLLINQEGVIVAKDLRGQQLIEKLTELLP